MSHRQPARTYSERIEDVCNMRTPADAYEDNYPAPMMRAIKSTARIYKKAFAQVILDVDTETLGVFQCNLEDDEDQYGWMNLGPYPDGER